MEPELTAEQVAEKRKNAVHLAVEPERGICGETIARTELGPGPDGKLAPTLKTVRPSALKREEVTCEECLAALKVTRLVNPR